MATAAQLKALRKKHGLGEFRQGARRRKSTAKGSGYSSPKGAVSGAMVRFNGKWVPAPFGTLATTARTAKGGGSDLSQPLHWQQLQHEKALDVIEGQQQ